MKSIELSDDQVEKLEDGENVTVDLENIGQTVNIQPETNSVEVNVVESVEDSGDATHHTGGSDTGRGEDSQETDESVPDLKNQLVKTLTEKKKLEKKIDSLQQEINHHNDQIRMAKEEDRDDLVRKVQDKKSGKMDRMKELNEEVNDLKEKEHEIRDRIDSIESA